MNYETLNAQTRGVVTKKHVSRAVSRQLTYRNVGFINSIQKDRWVSILPNPEVNLLTDFNSDVPLEGFLIVSKLLGEVLIDICLTELNKYRVPFEILQPTM